ncbi:MAG: glycosyltransferase [Pseudomonadota bacterium]
MRSQSCLVTIPCHNAQDWLERAIVSVLEHKDPRVAILVCDDGSSDGSLEIARSFKDQIHLQHGPNRGACHARNLGLTFALEQGFEHVLFLDADDYLSDQMLSGAIDTARRTAADMVVSDMHVLRADGTLHLRNRYGGRIQPVEFFGGWMAGDYVNPSGILWRTGFLEQIGGWDESLARAQDFDITLRAMFHEPRLFKNPTGAAIHTQVNPNSITRNQSENSLRSRYRAVGGLLASAKGTAFDTFSPQLCQELYHIARAAFRAGHRPLGREILAKLAHENYDRHPGTRLHGLAARLLGLETKVRLWRA